jgi:uncharacterized protein (UPF0332 family)
MPHELISTARKLLTGKPIQWDVRRAVSTAYYAMFHFLSLKCAEGFVISAGGSFSRARGQAYRSLDHAAVKVACVEAKQPQKEFPVGIVQFAAALARLQELRHAADYEEMFPVEIAVVSDLIAQAETAMLAFNAESAAHQRAFVVLAALRKRSR